MKGQHNPGTILLLALLTPLLCMGAVPLDPRNVNPVEVGSEAPAGSLTAPDGKKLTLVEAMDGKPTVLIFYRGSWCPYCTRHLAAVGQEESAIIDAGYQIIAISPDKPATIRQYIDQESVNYTLYSDSDMATSSAFGLSFKVDAATLDKLEGYNIDIEAASGKKHHLLPVPAVYVIGKDGRIRFRYYNPDYRERLSAEKLLEAL